MERDTDKADRLGRERAEEEAGMTAFCVRHENNEGREGLVVTSHVMYG